MWVTAKKEVIAFIHTIYMKHAKSILTLVLVFHQHLAGKDIQKNVDIGRNIIAFEETNVCSSTKLS